MNQVFYHLLSVPVTCLLFWNSMEFIHPPQAEPLPPSKPLLGHKNLEKGVPIEKSMVWISLSQFGCRNRSLYRVATDGPHLEVLGYYSPFAGKVGGKVGGSTLNEGPMDASSLSTISDSSVKAISVSAGLGSMYHSRQRVNDFRFSRKFSNVPELDQGKGSIPKLFESEANLSAQDDEGESLNGHKNPSVSLGNTQLLEEKIKEVLSENKMKLEKSFLKPWYEREFRPKLGCRCLLLPEGLSSNSTAFLHTQHHKLNRKTPQYLSAYELMIQRVRIDNDDEWDHFWNQIISTRVFIVEDWDTNIGNVETLNYDYGIKGFYKGEVDASYHDGQNGQSGKAKISIIIWKDSKIVFAEVYDDLACSSIHVAESYAVLALFFKCFELGIEDLLLWTDNSDIQGSITGSYTVKQERKQDKQGKKDKTKEEEHDLLLLLGCMKKRFKHLIALCKARELMFLADDLASEEASIPVLREKLELFNYQLNQKAIFRLSLAGSANATIKTFKNMRYMSPHQTHQKTFFLLVDYLDKLDAVAQLVDTLLPSKVYLAVHRPDEKAKDFQDQVKQIMGLKFHQGMVKDDCAIFYHTTKYDGKELLVVVDGTLPKSRYDYLDCFTVVFVSAVEKNELDPSMKELSALSYRYFSGVI